LYINWKTVQMCVKRAYVDSYSQTRLVSQRLMSHSAYCHRIFHPRPAPILNTHSVLRLLSLRLISQNG